MFSGVQPKGRWEERSLPKSLLKRSYVPALRASGILLILFHLTDYVVATAFAASQPHQSDQASQARQLSLSDRVAYQKAIEEVYWRHRTWPKERGPKPSLNEIMSEAQLEQKVQDYLRNSQALEHYWQRPISVTHLQAEMQRMAQHTRQSGILRELFAALGNDPFVIAECLARPALSTRLATQFYAYDQRFHGELKRRAEAELQAHPTVNEGRLASGLYREIAWVKSKGDRERDHRINETGIRINEDEWTDKIQTLETIVGRPEVGVFGELQEDERRYFTIGVIEKADERIKIATVEWRKNGFR